MPTQQVNGVQLFYELTENGDIPIVLIHGSWSSHHGWDQAVSRFGQSFRVLRYDRRGHSNSERPPGQGSILEDVADLAALIEILEIQPAWIVANSFGTSIAIRLAGERPDLFRGLIGHEPPLLAALADDPEFAPLLKEEDRKIRLVAELIAEGDHTGGAKAFVETVALGPGAWEHLPPAMRETLTENAPTFLDEARDPHALDFDPAWVRDFNRPTLLTKGTESPPLFGAIVPKVAAHFPDVEVMTFGGVGHIPHITHADEYVEAVTHFIRTHETK